MEKIIPFDKLAIDVYDAVLPQSCIKKLNELLLKTANSVAGSKEDPQFFIDFLDDPCADSDFSIKYRVAIINMLEKAGYSRIYEYGRHTVFRLPLSAKTLLPEAKHND